MALRVAIAMRASTQKQTRRKSNKQSVREVKVEDDLPLQRETCMKYIAKKPDWIFTGLEYVEIGVSGFHIPAAKRRGLNQALDDAKKGMFDILLVYKLDRLGRRSIESFNHAIKFLHHCRIWFVDKDREFTNSGDAEEVTNFIEFWSAKKASMDTKVRVTDAMLIVHDEGLWTGGRAPYGFEPHPTLANMLQVVMSEARVVIDIFNKYVYEGMGMTAIAAWLNERGIKTRTGKAWRDYMIGRILANTVYKGFLSYGKTETVMGENGSYQRPTGKGNVSDKYWSEYDFVGSVVWDMAAGIREKRINYDRKKVPKRTGTGKGILTGLLFCECGSAMTFSSTKRRGKRYEVYRCIRRMKAGKHECGAKRCTFGSQDIETAVFHQVKLYARSVIDSGFMEDVRSQVERADDDIIAKLAAIKVEHDKWVRAKQKLGQDLLKLSMGEDVMLSEEQLREGYDATVKGLAETERAMAALKDLSDIKVMTEVEVEQLRKTLLEWDAVFENSSIEDKRRFMGSMVERIELRGEDIVAHVSFDIGKLYETLACAYEEQKSVMQHDSDRCSNRTDITYRIKRTFIRNCRTVIEFVRIT